MIVDVITIFPDLVSGALPYGIVRRALEGGRLEVRVHDLRQWGMGAHRQVDDAPYGGGGGMVLRPEPLFAAVEAVEAMDPPARTRRILLSPSGLRCDQALLGDLSRLPRLLLICGRYEGVDERVRADLVDDEVSIGDYVLSGGELPALVLIEGLTRLLPGALGDPHGAALDSFSGPALDWPAWTRPAEFRHLKVPEVLLSGDHARIDAWRRDRSRELTRERRPDLVAAAGSPVDGKMPGQGTDQRGRNEP
jgi:tRNA (guanine37-N1)-methyltransferase